jgi:hypothetical protein
MDSKSSPLAMLAKTCSQIGADTSTLMTSSNRNKNSDGKPGVNSPKRSRSRSSSTEIIRVTDHRCKSKSPRDCRKTPLSTTSTTSDKTSKLSPVPTIRSGMDILGGHHPTLRAVPPTLGGYPPASSALSSNPFLASFASSLTSSAPPAIMTSNVCRDPLCRDPLCPTAIRNQQLLSAATGGLSYASLMNSPPYREAMMAFAAQQRMMAAAAAASAPPGSAGGPLPFVCNWMAGKLQLYTLVYSVDSWSPFPSISLKPCPILTYIESDPVCLAWSLNFQKLDKKFLKYFVM